MPLYEYQCQECGLHFERIEKASVLKDGRCPECGGAAHRLIGAPALQFKGSGWYVNDYGKGNGNGSRPTAKETETAKAAAESTADPKPKKKTEKKADAKVA
jgi:putative FmdB family regulatory protein